MSLIEQIDGWIIKMFKFNERETGGHGATYFPEGIKIDKITIGKELVYGHFNTQGKHYYFTDSSFVVEENGEIKNIKIKDISATNGSFRSDHSLIYVEAAGKR